MAYWRLYYHLVWGTKERLPFITPEVETMLYHHFGARAAQEGCRIFAINGMNDHIHMVLAIPPAKSVSGTMQIIKGASSHLVHTVHGKPFEWQEGYGAITISPRNISAAVQYVVRQKEHHAQNTLVAGYEAISPHNEGPKRRAIAFE